MSITVYSKPSCVQCNATYRRLDMRGIEYEVIDITTDPDALRHVSSMGYKQVPVVITGVSNWSGYRPDYIDAL